MGVNEVKISQFRALMICALLLTTLSPNALAESEDSGAIGAFDQSKDVPKGFAVHTWLDASEGTISPMSSLPIDNKGDDARNPDPQTSMRSRLTAVLPLCSESKATACLLSVESRVGKDDWKEGQVLPRHGQRWFNEFGEDFGKLTGTWNENAKRGLPAGDEARLWELALPHSGGNSYLISAMIYGYRTTKSGINEHDLQDFELSVRPTTVTRTTYDQCKDGTIEHLAPTEDFFKSEGNCVQNYRFPENLEIRVRVRFGFTIEKLGGFLDGRLFEPQFSYDEKTSILTVTGKPLVTTRASTKPLSIEEIESSKKLCDLFGCADSSSWARYKESVESDWAEHGYLVSAQANVGYSLDQVERFGEYLSEESFSEQAIWQVTSMVYSRYLKDCPRPEGFSGVVSTNASVYNPQPPTWNQREGALDFKVVSPHFRSDGRVFEGQYVLLLTPKVARCLWGSDYAKGTASLTVLYADGEQKIATSSLVQRSGWVQFRAFGFHFSSPTIRAKITKLGKPAQSTGPKKKPGKKG